MGRTWSRDDTLLVLASFLDCPRGMRLPPQPERERLANLIRCDVDEVTERLQSFGALAAGETAGQQATRLWQQYAHQPLECAIAADEILEERKRVPYHLKKRL